MASLLEDARLNEDLEEIATLTSDRGSITLFKLVKTDRDLYTFSFETEMIESSEIRNMATMVNENTLSSFTSFREMMVKLLSLSDLSLYQTRFLDPNLEKTYFSILAKECKTENLIGRWILTYSMN